MTGRSRDIGSAGQFARQVIQRPRGSGRERRYTVPRGYGAGHEATGVKVSVGPVTVEEKCERTRASAGSSAGSVCTIRCR